MPETLVILQGCEPMELMRNSFRHRVWIRRLEDSGSYFPEIEIRGEQDQVHGFIEQNWSLEEADSAVYLV
ncbi:MAG: hypothetical protein ACHQ1D_01350 [Nitrososphaerales archaeon]